MNIWLKTINFLFIILIITFTIVYFLNLYFIKVIYIYIFLTNFDIIYQNLLLYDTIIYLIGK